MACWHVGPCGIGCEGYVANPPPGQMGKIEFVPDHREELLIWMRKYSELQDRYIELLKQHRELMEKHTNNK